MSGPSWSPGRGSSDPVGPAVVAEDRIPRQRDGSEPAQARRRHHHAVGVLAAAVVDLETAETAARTAFARVAAARAPVAEGHRAVAGRRELAALLAEDHAVAVGTLEEARDALQAALEDRASAARGTTERERASQSVRVEGARHAQARDDLVDAAAAADAAARGLRDARRRRDRAGRVLVAVLPGLHRAGVRVSTARGALAAAREGERDAADALLTATVAATRLRPVPTVPGPARP